jgi:hypothetical protein
MYRGPAPPGSNEDDGLPGTYGQNIRVLASTTLYT